MPEVDGDIPDRAVALIVTGGTGPVPYLGSGRVVCFSPGCQVRIRSDREDYQGGQFLTLAVFAVLDQSPHVTGIGARSEESAPLYLGTDGADRHRWVVNLNLRYAWRRSVKGE